MVEKSWARTERGERIDQPDFQRVAERGPNLAVTQILSEMVWGQDGAGAILFGFACTNPGVGDPNMTVTRGAAIAGFRDRGQAYLGAVLAGGDASKTINVSTFPNGTYGVYVRLELRDAAFQNRIFWDQLATPVPVEVARSVPTLRSEDWSIAFEIISPGVEWLQVASFTLTGGVPGAITDRRRFLFEPRADASNLWTDNDWGSVAERNSNRTANGIHSLSRWIRAVGRQFQEVIGFGTWATDPNSGIGAFGPLNLTNLNAQKLAVNGDNSMTADLLPDGQRTRSLGNSTHSWLSGWIQRLRVTWNGVDQWTQFARWDGAGGGAGGAALYFGFQGVFVPVFAQALNCEWNQGGAVWTRITGGLDAYLYLFDPAVGFRALIHPSAGGATWADTVAAGTWEEVFTSTNRLRSGRPFEPSALIPGTNPPAGVPEPHGLYRSNVAKVLGRVVTDGVGGITLQANSGHNIASVAIISAGAGIQIVFQTPFANANYFAMTNLSGATLTAYTPSAGNIVFQPSVAPGSNVVAVNFELHGPQ